MLKKCFVAMVGFLAQSDRRYKKFKAGSGILLLALLLLSLLPYCYLIYSKGVDYSTLNIIWLVLVLIYLIASVFTDTEILVYSDKIELYKKLLIFPLRKKTFAFDEVSLITVDGIDETKDFEDKRVTIYTKDLQDYIFRVWYLPNEDPGAIEFKDGKLIRPEDTIEFLVQHLRSKGLKVLA